MFLGRAFATSAISLGLVASLALAPADAGAQRVAVRADSGHGTWISVGPLPRPAEWQTAVRLRDGRAFTFGSYTSSDAPKCLRTTALFDPSSNTWSRAARMHVRRCGASAIVLRSGRVLVAGGNVWPDRSGASYRRSAEIYDPGTDRWSFTGRMHLGRVHGAMALLPNGRVLIAGGFHRGGSLAEAEIFNPRTGRWTVTGSLTSSRDVTNASVATLPNGNILVAGGHYDIWNPNWHGHYVPVAERYVVSRKEWRPAGVLVGRGPTLVFHRGDGPVLAVRGRHVSRYLQRSHTWRRLPSLPMSMLHRRLSVEGITSVDGQPLVLAVRVTCQPARNLGVGYLWRPGRHEWVEWTTMPRPLLGTAMVNLRHGSTLVAGGVSRFYACEGGDHIPTRYAYRYYPSR